VLVPAAVNAQTPPRSGGPRAAAAASTAEETTVPDVVVRREKSEDEKAQTKLNEVPGGTSLVTSQEIERGRVASPADILSREPGVFAQSTSGGEAIRLSIRGSGIQRSPLNYLAGVSVLLDGLPLLTSTGVPWELVEPLASSRVEILRGANAFQYGALTLGGAINYVTHTGYDSTPFQARVEAGSFGYLRGQVSSGQVIGPFDYYVSASGFKEDGYREHADTSSARFVASLGYRFSPAFETRFFFRFAHHYFQLPFTLTWAQLQQDPRQSNAQSKRDNWYKLIPGSIFVANKSKLTFDDASTLEFGFAYRDFPQNGAGGPFVRWEASDISASLKYSRTDEIAGRQNKATLAILSSTAINPSVRLEGWPGFLPFPPFNWNIKGKLINSVQYAGADVVLLADNDFEAFPNLWLTTGIALSHAPRVSQFDFPQYDRASKDYNNYAPRAGVRYDVTPDIQVFGNISRSIEPPTNWSISAALSPGKNLDLKEQTAWTAEAGTRGRAGVFKWSLAYYHSWVQNELLTVNLPGLALTGTSNATSTKHQGVELGLDTLLWQSDAPAIDRAADATKAFFEPVVADASRQQILLRQVYTWNDFHYRNDPTFGTNRLPGLPVHFYKAELEYRHPVGFYVGANVESVFNSYPVDYANTYYSRPYALLGAKIGYAAPKEAGDVYQWEAYLEGRNLTNVKYASSVSTTFNAKGVDPSVYYPGDGVGVYGGVSFRY
jgi:iron complex outermembrane receptor protein